MQLINVFPTYRSLPPVFVTTTNISAATSGAAAATSFPLTTLLPFVQPSKCSQVQGTTHCTCEVGYTISGRDTSICTGEHWSHQIKITIWVRYVQYFTKLHTNFINTVFLNKAFDLIIYPFSWGKKNLIIWGNNTCMYLHLRGVNTKYNLLYIVSLTNLLSSKSTPRN